MNIFNFGKIGIRRLSTTLFITLVTLLIGCGGGSASNSDESIANEDSGQLMISLTDAEGDFLSYIVEVSNISLTHRNGSVINVLPETTQVDFAQYVDTRELLNIASIPLGAYDTASITLDFSNADITVQDSDGNPIQANAVNEDGASLAEVTVELAFGGRANRGRANHFVISHGLMSHITLDFDLDASNTIEFTDGGALVTVAPVLTADTLHKHAKPMRLRGELASVSLEEQQLTLQIRPFHKRHGRFGVAQIYTDNATTYEINGEPVISEEGLQILSALEPNAAVIALGDWNKSTRQFTASEILAGSSVPWDHNDSLRGTVVAREGNLITLRGALHEHGKGHVALNDVFTFSVSDATTVNKDHQAATITDIAIGSAIKASGTFIDDKTLDVSTGLVRIEQSTIAGEIISTDPLVLTLQLINKRQPDLFDFTGSGETTDQDSDINAYELDHGSLTLDQLAIGDLVKVRGYSNAFGAAPADFIAQSISDSSEFKAHLVVTYGRIGSLNAIASNTQNGLLLNVEDADHKHHIYQAGTELNLQTLAAAPLIVPMDEGGIYSIAEGKSVDVYTDYSAFVSSLDSQLGQGKAITRADAQGYYNSQDKQFQSLHLRITLQH